MQIALISLPFVDFPTWLLFVCLVVGLLGLTFGGDWLTNGAAAISVNLKISPLVIGLTIVSIATSMPELFTSLLAAKESPGLAVGNILGSNVANIGLILGATALICPLKIQTRLIYREVPILLIVTALFTILAFGGFNRIEGVVLLALTVAYLVYAVRSAREGPPDVVGDEFAKELESAEGKSNAIATGLVLLGGLFLALGADVLVGSSVEIASRWGVSDTLIGLTIVAIGTSLPELAASLAAARAGHSDICAGNIVGSNLFNLLLIGGSVSALLPFAVDPALFSFEFPAVFVLTVFLLWFFRTGHLVDRREGAILICFYVGILTFSALKQLGIIL